MRNLLGILINKISFYKIQAVLASKSLIWTKVTRKIKFSIRAFSWSGECWSALRSSTPICRSGAGVALRKFCWSEEWSATPVLEAGVRSGVHSDFCRSTNALFISKKVKLSIFTIFSLVVLVVLVVHPCIWCERVNGYRYSPKNILTKSTRARKLGFRATRAATRA